MRNFNDHSKRTLLNSCLDYRATASDAHAAKSHFKKSLILLTTLLCIFFFISNGYLFFELFNNDILHGLVAFTSLLLFFIMLFYFRSWTTNEKLKANKRQQLYLDYRIHLIEKNKIWFDISGSLRVLNVDQINDNVIKHLLTPPITLQNSHIEKSQLLQ